jgi:hypothetical protein
MGGGGSETFDVAEAPEGLASCCSSGLDMPLTGGVNGAFVGDVLESS